MEKQLSGVENQIGFAREIMNLYTWRMSEQTNGSGKYSEHTRLCKCIMYIEMKTYNFNQIIH